MKKVNIILLSFLILISGCTSDEYMDFTDTQIPIEHADAQFSAIGGQKEFTVNISENYTVTSDQSWCKATINDKTITINVEPNKTISGRTALLTIRSGKRTNYIPVTQTSAVITLDNYIYNISAVKDTVYIKYECDFPVGVSDHAFDWITSSVDHEKKEIRLIIDEEKNHPRFATVQIYADGGDHTVLTIREVSIRQNFLSYDDFIGPYTMYYSKSTSVTTPNLSIAVSLVANVRGISYSLKGLLVDDDIGSIVVYYDELTGSLSFLGSKIMTAQTDGSPDLWWAPYLRLNNSYYVTPSNTYGMVSADHDISDRLTFSLKNDGLNDLYQTIGFILRKYTGTTNSGNVNGKDGQPMYFYPTFERR